MSDEDYHRIAGHALILEGEEAFAKLAVARPDGMDGRTKDGKAFKEAAKDKIVLAEKDIEEMYAFKKKLGEAPEYGPLLFGSSGIAEGVIKWRDAITGAEAKCKPDWMSRGWRLTSATARYSYGLYVRRAQVI